LPRKTKTDNPHRGHQAARGDLTRQCMNGPADPSGAVRRLNPLHTAAIAPQSGTVGPLRVGCGRPPGDSSRRAAGPKHEDRLVRQPDRKLL
jgi:hypothetical protein